MIEFISEWEVVLERATEKQLVLEDRMKAFMLLKTVNLQVPDLKLIIKDLKTKTVDGVAPDDLYDQFKPCLFKFEPAGQLNAMCKTDNKTNFGDTPAANAQPPPAQEPPPKPMEIDPEMEAIFIANG